jgi:hypothetical protein
MSVLLPTALRSSRRIEERKIRREKELDRGDLKRMSAPTDIQVLYPIRLFIYKATLIGQLGKKRHPMCPVCVRLGRALKSLIDEETGVEPGIKTEVLLLGCLAHRSVTFHSIESTTYFDGAYHDDGIPSSSSVKHR